MLSINKEKLNGIMRQALLEDSCLDDITTKSLVYKDLKVKAVIRAKEKGVLAGINVARQVFSLVDKKLKFKPIKRDGQSFKKGDVLAKVSGPARSILIAERTALNFLCRLSGIATLTREFVGRAKPYKARILDTRKTTPGLRLLEKYAVRMGGGYNHRYDLAESILIKDNHISLLRRKIKHLDLAKVVRDIKKKAGNKEIEVEVDSVREFKELIKFPPDIIMLDNMNAAQIKECVKLRNKARKIVHLEVSGNVNLGNVKKIAASGVDRISVGKLTHSPRAIDISLEFIV